MEIKKNEPNIKAEEYYIAKSFQRCWSCEIETPVYAIYVENYVFGEVDGDGLYWGKVENFPTLLSDITHLSAPVKANIEILTNQYYKDGNRCFINYCHDCQSNLGNLHGSPGLAFFPTDEEEIAKITLYKVHGLFEAIGSAPFDTLLQEIPLQKHSFVHTVNQSK